MPSLAPTNTVAPRAAEMPPGARLLNSRERKQVYMHSTIFDPQGPSAKSLYAPNTQQMLADQIKARNVTPDWSQRDLSLPSPSDIQCTQNIGSNVVLPQERPAPARRAWEDNEEPLPARASSTNCLVADGQVIPVVRSQKDPHSIPKEYRAVSVNLQWSDPRNELNRMKANRDGPVKGAAALKRQEFSSEIFDKPRLTQPSTTNPGHELLSSAGNFLQMDSAVDPHIKAEGRAKGGNAEDSHGQFTKNLRVSHESTLNDNLAQADRPENPPMLLEESGRRQCEKNYSDLFGTQMPARQQIKERNEVLATTNISVFDTKSEIAGRNKGRWNSKKEGDDPAICGALRKEKDLSSNLFDQATPGKPDMHPEKKVVHRGERATWDTRDFMTANSEIARRGRMQEFEDDGRTALSRKFQELGSTNFRSGVGQDMDPNPTSPRASPHMLTAPVAPKRFERQHNPKEMKQAFLQSSIFA